MTCDALRKARWRCAVHGDGLVYSNVKVIGGCWVWKGPCKQDGHGYVTLKGKQVSVKRYSYQYLLDTLLGRGDYLKNSCGNPMCINPLHLYEAKDLATSKRLHEGLVVLLGGEVPIELQRAINTE